MHIMRDKIQAIDDKYANWFEFEILHVNIPCAAIGCTGRINKN